MVGKFLKYLGKEVSGLHEAAYLLAFFTFLSQLVALVRDRFFAHTFGAGVTLDVYYAAFRVPDIIFAAVASLVSISVLVPLLVAASCQGKDEERRYLDSIFSFFALLIVGISVVVFFAVPYIAAKIFPDLLALGKGADLILSMRIMLLSPLLLGFSNFFASAAQVRKRFIAYAIAPVLYNAGIIIGALLFYPSYGQAGLAIGVVIGAGLHMLIQIPYLVREGLFPRLHAIDWSIIKSIIGLSIFRTIALSSSQIALVVLMSFAGSFAVGAIAVFNFAWNLQSVPLAIVGVSYSMALFPLAARLFASGDRSGFVREISNASRHIVFWSMPIIVMFIVLRAQIVRTILGSGAFSWTDTRLTAATFALFTVSILAQALSLVFVRAYYAAGNTKTPFFINVLTSICIVLFSGVLVVLIERSVFFRDFLESLLRVSDLPGTAVLALPLGYSLALLFNLLLFLLKFEFDFKGYFAPVRETFFQSFSASVIGGFVAYLGLNIFNSVFDLSTALGVFLQGFFAGIMGIIVLIIVLLLLKSSELSESWRALHHRIWKRELAVAESEPVQ